MSAIRAVVFDLYGTLVDFSLQEYAAVLDAMAAHLSLSAPTFHQVWMDNWHRHELGEFDTVADYIHHVCIQLPVGVDHKIADADIEDAVAIHHHFQRNLLTPQPYCMAYLKTLHQRGYRLGVISNCPLETVTLWDQCTLASCVSTVVLSPVAGRRKPDRRIFDLMLHRLDVAAREAIMVGDSWHDDVLGAFSAGMRPVWLTYARNTPPNPYIADTIASLDELDRILAE